MKLEVNIIKKLPDFTIDVSFCCEAGEMQILTGPSGSGKTTLIRHLNGLLKPQTGTTLLHGNSILKDLTQTRKTVGMVFQDYALFPHLTVGENVMFGLEVNNRSGPEVEREALRHARVAQLDGRSARVGLNFTERGYGVRGAVGVPDRGNTAASRSAVSARCRWNRSPCAGARGVRAAARSRDRRR